MNPGMKRACWCVLMNEREKGCLNMERAYASSFRIHTDIEK